MKLSEAIRLGSMIRPQGQFHLGYTSSGVKSAKACARGSAFDAIGAEVHMCTHAVNFRLTSVGGLNFYAPCDDCVAGRQNIVQLNGAGKGGCRPAYLAFLVPDPDWDWAVGAKVRCPAVYCRDGQLDAQCRHERFVYNIIEHLNDFHEWTREAIADWVATIEPEIATMEPVEELQETV